MKKWFDEIKSEVSAILHHLKMFKELNLIIKGNSELYMKNTIAIDWMRKAFVVDLVIGIGRICDTTKNTKSLVKLLEQMNAPRGKPRGITGQGLKSFN